MPMSAEYVVDVIQCLSNAGVQVWLDGGWGVDALVGKQSREHDDLDIVIGWEHIETARVALATLGYRTVEDLLPCSLVLGAFESEVAPGRESEAWNAMKRVDIHPVTWDAKGGGLQAQPKGEPWRYPPEGFSGGGLVEGRPVHCLSAEVQVRCHDGYELDETDLADMHLLRDGLGVSMPDRVRRASQRL